MDNETDLLPEDVAAQAATDDAPQADAANEGSPVTPQVVTLEQVTKLLNEQREADRRYFQSQQDKLAARMERRIYGDPGQRAAKVVRDLGIQMTPEQEQQYLANLKAANALAPDPADEQDDQPQTGAGDADVSAINAKGAALFQQLGLQRDDPEAAWLYSARFDNPQAWLSAIQAAGDAKAARLARTPGGAQTQPTRQAAVPPLPPSSGRSNKKIPDRPTRMDAVNAFLDG